MTAIASLITSLTIVYSSIYSAADQSKHQSSASLVFVWGIHRGPVNSPHKWPVTRKMFPFDDVIMFDRHLDVIPLNVISKRGPCRTQEQWVVHDIDIKDIAQFMSLLGALYVLQGIG